MSVDEMTFYRFNLGAEIIKDVTFFSTKLKINNFFYHNHFKYRILKKFFENNNFKNVKFLCRVTALWVQN